MVNKSLRRNQRIRPRNSRKQRIRNKFVSSGSEEIISVTTGNNAFSGGNFPVVPTFNEANRLAQLALTFSQYRILHSRFEYVPQVSSTTNGRIALALLYDTHDHSPSTVVDIIQMASSSYGNLWTNHSVTMPPRSPEKRRYATISQSSLLALDGVQQQEYVPAVLTYATDSSTNGLNVGVIIWHYTIEFFNPNMVSSEDTSLGPQSLLAGLKDNHSHLIRFNDEDEE